VSESTAEDYHGCYWARGRQNKRFVLTHLCSDPTCLWQVEITRDVLGQWYARHEHSDFRLPTRTGPSTRTSPRYPEWQQAAEWALTHGLLAPDQPAWPIDPTPRQPGARP